MIIAGNGPYFSHLFQFLCWKTQNPVSTTYGFRVLCLIHSCVVITHCRIKQVYPLIKLHLWCPRLKKDGHLRCGRGICHLFWWLFFAKCLRVDEDGPGWGHPCHLDTFLVSIKILSFKVSLCDFENEIKLTKSNHFFPHSQWCICASLVKFHLLSHEIECTQGSFF